MFCSMSSFPAICDSKGSTWLYSKLSGHTTGWSDVKPSKLVALLSRHADRHHISHTAPVSIGFSLHSTALVSSPSQARNFIGCSRIPGLRALHRSGTWRSKSSWASSEAAKDLTDWSDHPMSHLGASAIDKTRNQMVHFKAIYQIHLLKS